ncbi:MAG TPA: glycosyltransferase family 4 protein [Dongiaceae bacterium]|nr:glycosyltransferase family 4 protein [Dongiaceae bacterium]
MMKILFLSHYFPPEVNAPATRTYEHCVRWLAQGHDVTVVTCQPNHPKGELYSGYRNRLWQEEQVQGVRVIRLWTLLSANRGFGLRTLNYVAFMLMCILFCWRFPRPDVVISTSPQFFNGLAGYFVARLRRARWVLEIRDLWPESIVAVGAMRDGMLIRWLYTLELFCYRACDLLVPVTDSFRDYMVGRGVDANKICVIKNGVDLTLFPGTVTGSDTELDTLFEQHRLRGKFIAAYVGTHGMAHHLDTVLEAAQQTRDRSDIAYLLVGDGAERERLAQQARRLNLDNLVMLEQMPKSKMPALWSRVQLSLILLKKSDTFKSVIPSKLFESLAMNKPVVLGVEGESARILEESGAGITIEPQSADALAAAVVRLADDPAAYAAMAATGKEYVSRNFDRDVLATRFAGAMGGLTGVSVPLVSAD